MRAAIYARVSTLDQEPENQLQELRRYIAADPLNLPVPRQGCQKLEEAGFVFLELHAQRAVFDAQATVAAMLAGSRPLNDQILRAMRLRRTVTHEGLRSIKRSR